MLAPFASERFPFSSCGQHEPVVADSLYGLSYPAFPHPARVSTYCAILPCASQLNGCAFCIQYHLNVARKAGLASAKIDLVAAWRDAGIYSARERAALAWTEALTLMSQRHVPDSLYEDVQATFTHQETVFLTSGLEAHCLHARLSINSTCIYHL
ncbi:carboxymuconolactone decarboxylase family protein [Erwinia sp. HDF1-3R]|uniref:carboxymuconolactone decarboxylase family protein n=1 Tax=Erwinia sp. HDF1-3R TaxID=3141543 RepID=UPI0031F5B023